MPQVSFILPKIWIPCCPCRLTRYNCSRENFQSLSFLNYHPCGIGSARVVVLGFRLSMPPLYYFYALLLLLFGAIILMCFDAVVILLMMRVSVFTRSKDRFMVITQILMFVGIFAYVISNMGAADIVGQSGEVTPSIVRYIVPLSDKAIEAMALPSDPASPLKIIGLIALALVFMALLITLSSRIYLQAARESRSGGRYVHKPMTEKGWRKLQKTGSNFAVMVTREVSL